MSACQRRSSLSNRPGGLIYYVRFYFIDVE
jgi:hypothetical protein